MHGCIKHVLLAFASGSASNKQSHNLRTLAFTICRQEHFREFAEGIVPQVNDAIALARGLKMPIYYSNMVSMLPVLYVQHAGHIWFGNLKISRCGPDAMVFPCAGHPDPATDHNRNVIVCEDPCTTRQCVNC